MEKNETIFKYCSESLKKNVSHIFILYYYYVEKAF